MSTVSISSLSMCRSTRKVVLAWRRTRIRLVSLLVVVVLLAAVMVVLPVVAQLAAAAVGDPPVTVTRVDSSVTVTPDSTGRVTIPYCPAADPCAFASLPAGVVVTGRAPNGGLSAIPGDLVAYGQTTKGFTLRALDTAGNPITSAITLWYHAASDLTPDEEVRTVTVTTDTDGYATIGYASPHGSLVPTAVVASGASPDGGGDIPVSLVLPPPRTASAFTVRALNQSGAAIASNQISLSYYAAWAARIDPGTGWVAANATKALTTDPKGLGRNYVAVVCVLGAVMV